MELESILMRISFYAIGAGVIPFGIYRVYIGWYEGVIKKEIYYANARETLHGKDAIAYGIISIVIGIIGFCCGIFMLIMAEQELLYGYKIHPSVDVFFDRWRERFDYWNIRFLHRML